MAFSLGTVPRGLQFSGGMLPAIWPLDTPYVLPSSYCIVFIKGWILIDLSFKC